MNFWVIVTQGSPCSPNRTPNSPMQVPVINIGAPCELKSKLLVSPEKTL